MTASRLFNAAYFAAGINTAVHSTRLTMTQYQPRDLPPTNTGLWRCEDMTAEQLQNDYVTELEEANANQRARILELEVEAGRLSSRLNDALEIIDVYIDDNPCRFDHHGFCQEHNLAQMDDGRCGNTAALELRAALGDV
jgi:hypothetical protein